MEIGGVQKWIIVTPIEPRLLACSCTWDGELLGIALFMFITPKLTFFTSLCSRSKKNSSSGPQSFMELDPDDDDPDPSKNSVGWLWRVIRAALPFQMAILAIFCVACLLEPHCCDSMNNLNFSLTPQLRYMRGPPPV